MRNRGVAFGLGGDISAVLIGATIVMLLGLLVFLAAAGATGGSSGCRPRCCSAARSATSPTGSATAP